MEKDDPLRERRVERGFYSLRIKLCAQSIPFPLKKKYEILD